MALFDSITYCEPLCLDCWALSTCSYEMDKLTKKMSSMLEREGYLNEYQEDFEEVKKSIYRDMQDEKD